jgi:hypothetical protein
MKMVKITNVRVFKGFFKDWNKEHTAIQVKNNQKDCRHLLGDSL